MNKYEILNDNIKCKSDNSQKCDFSHNICDRHFDDIKTGIAPFRINFKIPRDVNWDFEDREISIGLNE